MTSQSLLSESEGFSLGYTSQVVPEAEPIFLTFERVQGLYIERAPYNTSSGCCVSSTTGVVQVCRVVFHEGRKNKFFLHYSNLEDFGERRRSL